MTQRTYHYRYGAGTMLRCAALCEQRGDRDEADAYRRRASAILRAIPRTHDTSFFTTPHFVTPRYKTDTTNR